MRILLGVSAGIAAYKAIHVLRLLQEQGHDVVVMPTPESLNFVGASTWEALAGHPIHTTVWQGANGTEHVSIGRSVDAVIIAPATANFMARYVAGHADDMLTATLLMVRAPILISPAMHTEMWFHPATQHNVSVLQNRGVGVLPPAEGPLAGRDVGAGRLPEPEEIVAALFAHIERSAADREAGEAPAVKQSLAGERVLISAGGTQEPLDPVRYLGNRSSGRQGVELARQARARGAKVHLVAANVAPELTTGVADQLTSVRTTQELQEVMNAHREWATTIVMVAAVADFRPKSVEESKIKKTGDAPTIELVENPDILAGLAAVKTAGQVVVGFAAETGDSEQDVIAYGIAKAQRKGADLLAINQVGENTGFGDVPNSVTIVDSGGTVLGETKGTKAEVSAGLWDAISNWRNEHRQLPTT